MTKMLQETTAAETQEANLLTETEIDSVSGAAGIRLSVEDGRRAALAQRLEKAYANSHPYEYYGPFG